MSMRMELSDLPPKYRAQAEAQIAARCRAKAPTLEAVAAAAKKTGREFDSRGEYDYYMGMILPKVQRGEIVKVESHRRFTMLPEKEYGNASLQNKGVERFLNFLRACVQLIQKQTIRLFSCDHPGRAKHTAPVHDLRHTNDIFRCKLAAQQRNTGQPHIFGKLLHDGRFADAGCSPDKDRAHEADIQ